MPDIGKPPNPYYDTVSVRDLDMLFGREDELQEIYELSKKQQSISIVGLPNIGKSSILHHIGERELQERLEYNLEHHTFVLLDLRDYLQKTPDDFFRAVCEQIIVQSPQMQGFELSVEKGQDQFARLLQHIHGTGQRLVLLMDAFDRVTLNTAFDPAFFSFLRSLATRGWVSYITASVKRLIEVCHPGVTTSPFFNIFRPCHLGPLTHEEALELVTTPAKRAGYPITPEEATWIITQAGRHPFFLQVTCRMFFEEKYRRNTSAVDLARVQEITHNQLLPYFDDAWNALDEAQRSEFLDELRWRSNTTYRLLELSESTLFRKHISEKFNLDDPNLSIEDLKEALDNLNNNEFLANSKFASTYYVSMQCDRTTTTVNQKGMIVRDFLKTALERIGSTGTRSDSAPEWRLYNILYYHYLKYGMSNDQIAARLLISRRTFYRDQDKAIQILLKEVYEMERMALNKREP
jgi:hypothetical protein